MVLKGRKGLEEGDFLENEVGLGECERDFGTGFVVGVEENLVEGGVVCVEMFAVTGFGIEAEELVGFEKGVKEVGDLVSGPSGLVCGEELLGGVEVSVFGDGFEEGPDELVGIRWLRGDGFWFFRFVFEFVLDGSGAIFEGLPFVEKGGVGLTDKSFEVFFGGDEIFVF